MVGYVKSLSPAFGAGEPQTIRVPPETPNDNASYVVTLTTTDKDGGSNIYENATVVTAPASSPPRRDDPRAGPLR